MHVQVYITKKLKVDLIVVKCCYELRTTFRTVAKMLLKFILGKDTYIVHAF